MYLTGLNATTPQNEKEKKNGKQIRRFVFLTAFYKRNKFILPMVLGRLASHRLSVCEALLQRTLNDLYIEGQDFSLSYDLAPPPPPSAVSKLVR